MIGLNNFLKNEFLKVLITFENIELIHQTDFFRTGSVEQNFYLIEDILINNLERFLTHQEEFISDKFNDLSTLNEFMKIKSFDDLWRDGVMKGQSHEDYEWVLNFKTQTGLLYNWINSGFHGFIIKEIYELMKNFSDVIIKHLFTSKADNLDPDRAQVQTAKISSILSTKYYTHASTYKLNNGVYDLDVSEIELDDCQQIIERMEENVTRNEDYIEKENNHYCYNVGWLYNIRKNINHNDLIGGVESFRERINEHEGDFSVLSSFLQIMGNNPNEHIGEFKAMKFYEEFIGDFNHQYDPTSAFATVQIAAKVHNWAARHQHGDGGSQEGGYQGFVIAIQDATDSDNFDFREGDRIYVTKESKNGKYYYGKMEDDEWVKGWIKKSHVEKEALPPPPVQALDDTTALPPQAEIRIDCLSGRVCYSSLIKGKNIFFDGNYCYCRGWFPFDIEKKDQYITHYIHIVENLQAKPFYGFLEVFIENQFYTDPRAVNDFENKYFISDQEELEEKDFEEFIKDYVRLLSFVKLMCMFIFYHKNWYSGIRDEYKTKYLLSFVQRYIQPDFTKHANTILSQIIEKPNIFRSIFTRDYTTDLNIVKGTAEIFGEPQNLLGSKLKNSKENSKWIDDTLNKDSSEPSTLWLLSNSQGKYMKATVNGWPKMFGSYNISANYDDPSMRGHSYLVDRSSVNLFTEPWLPWSGERLGQPGLSFGEKFLPFNYLKQENINLNDLDFHQPTRSTAEHREIQLHELVKNYGSFNEITYEYLLNLLLGRKKRGKYKFEDILKLF